MNYELAKELKDAGFPEREIPRHSMNGIDQPKIEKWMFNIPTLSELIEACNPQTADDFVLSTKYGKWEATLMYAGYFQGWNTKKRDYDGFVGIDESVIGSSPEEAVAKLWIVLNGITPLREKS